MVRFGNQMEEIMRIRSFPIAAVILWAFIALIPALCGSMRADCQPLPGVEALVRASILDLARQYLGVRYRLGGHTPRGFDCSGFVYYVFHQSGIAVPRTASAQYQTGRKIVRSQLKPGDLVFFSRRLSRPSIQHVGIYTGENRFIHSPSFGGRVSFASMNDGYWRARYLGSVTFCVRDEERRELSGKPALSLR